MKLLGLALSFLTVFPVRVTGELRQGDLGRAAAWYSLVGLLLGVCLAAARYLFGLIFPETLAAVLVVALWALLTGGLHLDGLADCCDGLLASVSPERRLEIMKDPRMGSFAGAGLVLFLLLKVGAVLSLPAGLSLNGLLALLLAPCLARWLLLLAARQPMARPGGLGVEFALGVRGWTYAAAAAPPVILLLLAGWFEPSAALAVHIFLALALAHLAALGVIRLARARLGGLTGDVLGLTVELGELAVLLAFAVRS